MKTENELHKEILQITLTINEKYPELSKYLDEMPVTIPDESSPDINVQQLQSYYHSLSALLKKYQDEHPVSS